MQLIGKVEGAERVSRALHGAAIDFERPIRPVAPALSQEISSMVREQYQSRGRRGPRGRAWTRKQSTIDRYTAMNRRGFRVLNEEMRRTDALRTSETTRNGPHSIEVVGDDALIRGTDLHYGLIQHRRGQTQFDPTEEDERRFAAIIKRGLRDKFVDRGFDYVDRPEIPF